MVYGPVNNQFYTFLKGTFFVAVQQGSRLLTHTDWTNQSIMVSPRFPTSLCVPVESINRNDIVYPSGVGGNYLTIDVDPIVICAAESAKFPYLPKQGDVVKVTTQGS